MTDKELMEYLDKQYDKEELGYTFTYFIVFSGFSLLGVYLFALILLTSGDIGLFIIGIIMCILILLFPILLLCNFIYSLIFYIKKYIL